MKQKGCLVRGLRFFFFKYLRFFFKKIPFLLTKNNKKPLIFKKKFSELVFKEEPFNPKYLLTEEGNLVSFEDNIFKVKGILGFIYCGIIKNVELKLNASFVYIGRSKNGFLHWNDSLFNETSGYFTTKFLGKKTLVQVLKEEFGTKGCRLTNNITLSGKLIILTPFSKNYGISKKIKNTRERFFLKKTLKKISSVTTLGIIIRTDTRFEFIITILKDLNFLLNKWLFLKKKTDLSVSRAALINQNFKSLDNVVKGFIYKKFDRIVTPNAYLYNFFFNFFIKIKGFLTKNLSLSLNYDKTNSSIYSYGNKIKLPSGGNIIFEETEALTSVDVNTGSHKNNKLRESFSLKVNLEASKKVVEVVLLKNISGLIIIDFVDMGNLHFDKKVFGVLTRLFFLSNSLLKTKVLPMSKLGIMQLTRQRDIESKFKFYFQKCYYCKGSGIITSVKQTSNYLNDKVFALLHLSLKTNPNTLPLKVVKIHLNTKLFYFLKTKYTNYFMFLKNKFKVLFFFKPDLNLHLNKFFIKYKF